VTLTTRVGTQFSECDFLFMFGISTKRQDKCCLIFFVRFLHCRFKCVCLCRHGEWCPKNYNSKSSISLSSPGGQALFVGYVLHADWQSWGTICLHRLIVGVVLGICYWIMFTHFNEFGYLVQYKSYLSIDLEIRAREYRQFFVWFVDPYWTLVDRVSAWLKCWMKIQHWWNEDRLVRSG